jgi:protein-L-isoaspartate(D-aspartate) O-methyltransferase
VNSEIDAIRDRFYADLATISEPDPRLAEALRMVDRADFVPSYFLPDRASPPTWPVKWEKHSRSDGVPWAEHVYSPHSALVTKLNRNGIPLSSSTDPSLMVTMIHAVQPLLGDRILEIGVGTGFNAAILSYLVGSDGLVASIDIDSDICTSAAARLRQYPNVRVVQGDGRLGFVEQAPYQCIVVTANANCVERAWLSQLASAGRIIVNLQGPMDSGLFVGALTEEGDVRGRFLDLPPMGFTPLYGSGTSAGQDIGNVFPDELTDAAVPDVMAAENPDEMSGEVAHQLIEEREHSYARYYITGSDQLSPGILLHRGGERCWIRLAEFRDGTRQTYSAGDPPLLSALVSAYDMWISVGRPKITDLDLQISPAGTRVSIDGKVVLSSPLFAPMPPSP